MVTVAVNCAVLPICTFGGPTRETETGVLVEVLDEEEPPPQPARAAHKPRLAIRFRTLAQRVILFELRL